VEGYFAHILESFGQGTAASVSSGFFESAFLSCLISTVFYILYLLWRNEKVRWIGFGLAAIGTAMQTAALILRWMAAGWAHPPFTNLYESLVFFAWGIVLVYLIVELKSNVKIAGAFVVPIACMAMGLASLNPEKEIQPLLPALQSIWLHMHVMFASIGYAAFLVSFVFSVLYLYKDGLPLSRFTAASGAFTVFGILAVARAAIFRASFLVPRVTFAHGKLVKIPIEGGGPTDFVQTEVPGLGAIMLAALIFGAITLIVSIYLFKSDPEEKKNRTVITIHAVHFIIMTYVIFHYMLMAARNDDIAISAAPYSFAMLLFAWLMGLVVVILYARMGILKSALPDARALDRYAHRSIMVAFPIMTLVIVTGSIWANQAWGRYWGWDPKETASLVTWIIYLLYLHTRVTHGWTGRRTAYIAIIGFVSVVFTYLGVNLLLAGLHAYATG